VTRTQTRTPARSTAARLAAVLGLAGALVLPVTVPGVAPHGLGTAVASADSRPAGDRVLDEAPKHQGKPYRYGATGPDAFDCSGFTQYAFGQVGVALPRTSADQYAASEKVAKADRRPGDLIAMRNSNGAVTHVGIYAGHDDWWVASTGSKRVILQDLYSSNYSVGRFS
jgi:peptidoglycan DL-endopeptidase CwlO